MTLGQQPIVRDGACITLQCEIDRLFLMCAIRFRLHVALPVEGEGVPARIAVLEGGVVRGMTEPMDVGMRELDGVSEGLDGLVELGVEGGGGEDGAESDEGGEDGEEGEDGEGGEGEAEQDGAGVGGAELGAFEDGLGVVMGEYVLGAADMLDTSGVEEAVGVVCTVCTAVNGDGALGVEDVFVANISFCAPSLKPHLVLYAGLLAIPLRSRPLTSILLPSSWFQIMICFGPCTH